MAELLKCNVHFDAHTQSGRNVGKKPFPHAHDEKQTHEQTQY